MILLAVAAAIVVVVLVAALLCGFCDARAARRQRWHDAQHTNGEVGTSATWEAST